MNVEKKNMDINASTDINDPTPVFPMPGKPSATSVENYPGERVILQVGQLTRQLHDSLRALGYDKALQAASAEIPDARDRLSYVAEMTERAAERALNATEVARPIQDQLSQDAETLDRRWQRLFDRELSLEDFRALVGQTRGFLAEVPKHTSATNAQLLEIMMAQDFQDLTGQVIKRVAEVTRDIEAKLLKLLLENVPSDHRPETAQGAAGQGADGGLLNGPVIKPEGRSDVVANQGQVDDLLESLGF